MGEMRHGWKKNAYKPLFRKFEVNRPFGTPNRGQKDNIKTALKGNGWRL
jgi:hypothetical protein